VKLSTPSATVNGIGNGIGNGNGLNHFRKSPQLGPSLLLSPLQGPNMLDGLPPMHRVPSGSALDAMVCVYLQKYAFLFLKKFFVWFV